MRQEYAKIANCCYLLPRSASAFLHSSLAQHSLTDVEGNRIVINQQSTKTKMKKLITIWISCSLVLAASAMAQQDEEQQTQKKKQSEKASPAREAKPAANAESARKEHAETKAPGQAKTPPKPESTRPVTKAQAETPEKNANRNEQQTGQRKNEQAEQRKNQRAARNEPANKQVSPAPAAATAPTAASGAAQAGQRNAAGAQKPDIQKIKAEHANFHAQPKPDKVQAVTFNQNYRINGAEKWQGGQYEVFRSYHPEWHDQNWYHSHYNRVELIGGGYYFWNNGYWYPAWGYNPSAQYYAYDGPIYVGSRAEPPDRVIADVQASLQEQGYYKGEVDGLLGPLTREALTAYQSDHGLYATAAIDEPTLDSLGMG
jgi:Putative peptidoglycan binding domain